MSETMTRAIRDYVLEEFLPEEDRGELRDDTPLFSSGVLDSIASLRLVAFLEEEFGIKIEPHEVVPDNLDTLNAMTQFVGKKQSGGDG